MVVDGWKLVMNYFLKTTSFAFDHFARNSKLGDSEKRESLQGCNLCNWNDGFLNGELTMVNYGTLSAFVAKNLSVCYRYVEDEEEEKITSWWTR